MGYADGVLVYQISVLITDKLLPYLRILRALCII